MAAYAAILFFNSHLNFLEYAAPEGHDPKLAISVSFFYH